MTPRTPTEKSTATKATSKAGTASNPQTTAAGLRGEFAVAPGRRMSLGGQVFDSTSDRRFTAEDFKTKRDPEGTTGLRRLVEGGNLVNPKRSAEDTDDRAGGGLLERGGAMGAGPSAAQIIAADAGDEGSRAVVDAALGGSKAELEAAADPEGAAAREQAKD